MRLSRLLVSSLAAMAASLAIGTAAAQSLDASVGASGLIITAGWPSSGQMKVTIVGPGGDRLVEEVVPANVYHWSGFFQDGEYRYDAYLLSGDAGDGDSDASGSAPVRVQGRFVVAGGALNVPRSTGAPEDEG